MLWVDVNGAVAGPALSLHDGLHFDGNGYAWGVQRLTGEVQANHGFSVFRHIYTSSDCTTGEFVAATSPGVVMELDGVYRVPPLNVPPSNLVAQSRFINGTCETYGLTCLPWVACYPLAQVQSWPALTKPADFAGPMHVEYGP